MPLFPRKPKYTIVKVARKRDIPEDLWTKCGDCGELIYNKKLDENLRVCPKCGFHFTIGGHSGPDYTIQASTNLTNWLPVWTNRSPVTPFPFTDPNTTNFNQRFYRVLLGP